MPTINRDELKTALDKETVEALRLMVYVENQKRRNKKEPEMNCYVIKENELKDFLTKLKQEKIPNGKNIQLIIGSDTGKYMTVNLQQQQGQWQVEASYANSIKSSVFVSDIKKQFNEELSLQRFEDHILPDNTFSNAANSFQQARYYSSFTAQGVAIGKDYSHSAPVENKPATSFVSFDEAFAEEEKQASASPLAELRQATAKFLNEEKSDAILKSIIAPAQRVMKPVAIDNVHESIGHLREIINNKTFWNPLTGNPFQSFPTTIRQLQDLFKQAENNPALVTEPNLRQWFWTEIGKIVEAGLQRSSGSRQKTTADVYEKLLTIANKLQQSGPGYYKEDTKVALESLYEKVMKKSVSYTSFGPDGGGADIDNEVPTKSHQAGYRR